MVSKNKSKLPPTLYHYTNLNGLKGIIDTRSLWATDIYYLNDFSEMSYAFEFIIKRINSYLDTIPDADCHNKGMRTFADDEIRTEFEFFEDLKELINGVKNSQSKYFSFVCSFSKDGDKLSQWRGYSPNDGGYCIAFDTNKLIELGEVQSFEICECLYDPKKNQKKLVDQIISKGKELFEESSKKYGDTSVIFGVLVKLYFIAPKIKDPAFNEETEWRLFMNSTRELTFNSDSIKYRKGLKMLIPYTEFVLSENIQDLPIKSITVGPMPHQELAKRSLYNYLNDEGFKCDIGLSSIPYRIL
jgi:hypothetical protein